MNAKQLMIGLGFSMLAAANAPALAVDAKTLPGAACYPNTSTPTAFYIGNNGMLINNSAATLTVICPIVRDVMAANSSNGISNAQVHVVDNNNLSAGTQVTCTLESRTTNSNVVETFTDYSDAGASPAVQVLDNYADIGSGVNGYTLRRHNL
jgi:hypothetical protein